MKSHSVKSNAKRAARKLAAKFPGLFEPVEPSEAASVGNVSWYPSVEIRSGVSLDAIPAEVIESCVVVNHPDVATAERARRLFGDGVPEPTPEPVKRPVPGKDEPAKPKPSAKRKVSAKEMMAAAATLPPRKEYTREELAELRRRRKEQTAREIAEGIRTPDGKKINRTRADVIVELTSRPGGATVAELTDATGWQPHTVRGYIAGTLRKRGHDIQARKMKGEPTRYTISKDQ